MTIIGAGKIKYFRHERMRRPEHKGGYRRRNQLLNSLGYTSYKQYLQSDLWKSIREEKLRRHPTCILCPSAAEEIHHVSYAKSVLTGDAPQLLVTLCSRCHTEIEVGPKGKRTHAQANDELFARAADNPRAAGWVKMVRKSIHQLKTTNPYASYDKAMARKAEKIRRQLRDALEEQKKLDLTPRRRRSLRNVIDRLEWQLKQAETKKWR